MNPESGKWQNYAGRTIRIVQTGRPPYPPPCPYCGNEEVPEGIESEETLGTYFVPIFIFVCNRCNCRWHEVDPRKWRT